jgi:hypothetical protein
MDLRKVTFYTNMHSLHNEYSTLIRFAKVEYSLWSHVHRTNSLKSVLCVVMTIDSCASGQVPVYRVCHTAPHLHYVLVTSVGRVWISVRVKVRVRVRVRVWVRVWVN